MKLSDQKTVRSTRGAASPALPARATVATVAADAGVSLQTVSNAINAPHLLRPATLERVPASIERLRKRRLPMRGLAAIAADSIDSGAATAREMLQAADPPTAFVCVSDAIAIGVLRAVQDRGLRARADVGVVGFDDSPGAQLTRPALSSVGRPLESAAEHVIRILLSHPGHSRVRHEHVLLVPDLVVRRSSVRV